MSMSPMSKFVGWRLVSRIIKSHFSNPPVVLVAHFTAGEVRKIMSTFKGKIAQAVAEENLFERNVTRASSNLPQTTQSALFRVTGLIKIINIIGEVTTVIQTQANNTKLVHNPDTGSDTDLCAVLDITAKAVGSTLNITGTLANAMVNVANGAGISQATHITVTKGTIDLNCAASNTGAIKWSIRYIPLEEGAKVIAV